MLHVVGECQATYAEPHLVLRPHRAAAPTDTSVQAAVAIEPDGPPPVFTITVPAGRWYALEVCTDLKLFDGARRGARRDSSFFASWTAGLLTSPRYRLPSDVWERFRGAKRLFYRILTSTRPDGWANPAVWPAQFADAPFITLGTTADRRTLTLVVAFRDTVTPVQVPQAPVRLRLDRPSDEIFDTVAILTSGVEIPIDVAR
jgi:hypothetical protein